MFAIRRLATLATHLTTKRPTAAAPLAGATPSKLGNYLSTAAPSAATMGSAKDLVDAAIKENDVLVFSKTYCPYCRRAKNILAELTNAMKVYELDEMEDGSAIQAYLKSLNGQGTVPHIYIKQEFIGGCSDLQALSKAELQKRIAA